MPEGLEAEIWRRALTSLVGRTVVSAWVDERVADPDIPLVLAGAPITAIRRRGKIIVVDVGMHSVGLHFGMTGRVVVDGEAAIDALEYASKQDRPEWDRLRVWTATTADGDPPALRVNDPRRLGRTTLDPDLGHLGVDFFDVKPDELAVLFGRRRAAIKAVLLDQGVIAGLGNLCADEVLYWAGVAPRRPADSLSTTEIRSLVTAMRRRLPVMLRRGGSTHGALDPRRRASGGPCPRGAHDLERATIGGRTAVWCAQHQH